MRVVAFLACLALATTAGAARHPLPTLSPPQAIARAAASAKPVRALFQFRVARAVKARDGYYLDSAKDFRSAANLGIVIRASAMPRLTKKFGNDPQAAFVGKTVKLIGQVQRVAIGAKGHASMATQVEVTHAGQILSVG